MDCSSTPPRPVLALASVLLLAIGGIATLRAQENDPYLKTREKMVDERVEREGVRNEAVLRAMMEVPRHLFVQAKYYPDAYREVIIDIGYKQTLSTAYIVGYMTEAIDPQPGDKVLEIGTGSGYQAAVLSKIVKEVYTIEIVEPLAREATERLKRLGFSNVHVRYGDGYKGWPEHAPFDKIIVTCSPESVPQPLLDQLREGGKMIIPLGERYRQAFFLFEKKDGKITKTRLLPTLFVPMTGQAEDERKVRTNPAIPRIYNGGFEIEKEGSPDGWFYLRQATLERKASPQGKSYLAFSNRESGRDAHALQAFGVDGRRVRSVSISLLAQADGVVPGAESYERPALAIRFFDGQNRSVGEDAIPLRLGTFRWNRFGKEVRVPREAQMAMIQVGLRGATGLLCVDDLRMTSHPR
jgi:protein-L-isoaspartate(D-aspartate) O-methyltransferase